MIKYLITILPEERQIQTPGGITVQKFLREQGLKQDAPCGGKGTCKKCRVTVNGKEELACQVVIDRDMRIELPEVSGEQILTKGQSASFVPDGTDRYVMAFDIGTTTVAGYLLDGKNGETLAEVSCPNPQREFGADVISRIQYALTEDKEGIQKVIREALGDLIGRAAQQAGCAPKEITAAAVVGNTCMHHLFLGIDVKPLATPPYEANVTAAQIFAGREYLPAVQNTELRVLPNISGFVGADTVGCLLAADFDQEKEWTLLVDIGTNGEMVLGRGSQRIACSTAAGPAFEGAKIECGMRGAKGAIDHVWLEGEEIRCSVIGGGRAVGICGSGILDATAVLLKKGLIAPNGRMKEKRVMLKDDVYLSQKDVRQVQLAKAAIRSGIELLAKKSGIETIQIQKLLLAGAFGSHMSPESACAIGLLPPVLLEKIRPVGNAAGEGAKAAAISRAAFEKSKHLAEGTDFLELASLPEFQNTYLALLDFKEVSLWNK